MRNRTLSLSLMLLLLVGSVATAAPQGEMGVVFEILNDGNTMEMKLMSSDEGTRFDMMGGERGDASMVWRNDGGMLMMMHSQRMYMEFTKEMMERMRQMMQQMGRAPEQPDDEDLDVSEYTFEETGNTDTINGMDAFEVRVSGPDGEQSMLWMTTATDIGLLEAMVEMMKPLREMAMPGMNNPMERFAEYRALAQAQGLPAGKVIRVIDPDSGSQITLKETFDGPFEGALFQAPEGYTKQQMPMMR
jgi:hypothetical protein